MAMKYISLHFSGHFLVKDTKRTNYDSMKLLGSCLLLGITMTLFSCQKGFDDLIPPSSNSNLKDIKVSSTFNWSTSKTVDVNITGLPTGAPVISTLIISLDDGSNIYQGSQNMSQTRAIQIIVPVTENEIKLKFGSMEYRLPINNNKVDFSFVPEVQD
jgi:hypothetical protein